jgi:hypothetical protein
MSEIRIGDSNLELLALADISQKYHGLLVSNLAKEVIRLRARIAELEHPHVETGDWASKQHNPWTEDKDA